MGFPGALVVKNPSANAGDIRNMDSIPGSGRSPGGEDGSPLQYSCLENPMDRGAWQDTIHRVAKSQTRLSDFTFTFTHKFGRRKWQPTPVSLPEKSHGQRSLAGYSP